MFRRWLGPGTEIITVGLPFCVFKILTGVIALTAPMLAPFGYALIAVGAVDGVLNVVNLVALAVARKPITSVCIAQQALGGELGLAVDVFLSFALVAIVIGGGALLRLPAWALPIWNIAVVANVLGAGFARLVPALAARAEAA